MVQSTVIGTCVKRYEPECHNLGQDLYKSDKTTGGEAAV